MSDINRDDISAWVAEMEKGTWDSQWKAAVPARFQRARLADLDPEVQGPIGRWADAWRHDSPEAGALILTGAVGTGKTYAAVAAAEVVGQIPLFVPVVELLDALRPGGDPGRFNAGGSVATMGEAKYVHFGRTLERSLLILDDLGAERPTDWTAERLYALVNRRWMEQQPTIVTTNVNPAWPELAEAFGDRVLSRLADGATILRLTGEDRRRA